MYSKTIISLSIWALKFYGSKIYLHKSGLKVGRTSWNLHESVNFGMRKVHGIQCSLAGYNFSGLTQIIPGSCHPDVTMPKKGCNVYKAYTHIHAKLMITPSYNLVQMASDETNSPYYTRIIKLRFLFRKLLLSQIFFFASKVTNRNSF